MKKISIIYLLILAIIASCEDKLEFEPNGEALYNFQLTGPSDNANVVLNSATPDSPVVIEWTAAKTGVNALVTYAFVAAQQGGNLDAPLIELKSDNEGTVNKLTITQKQLDEALKAKGIADGAKADLIWSVKATNGSQIVSPEKPYNISITRFGNGVSNFILYGPKSSTEPIELNEDTPDDTINILWEAARSGKEGVPVTYKWVAVNKGESFDTPLLEIASDNNGTDAKLTVTQKQLNDLLTAKGVARAQQIDLDWTVIATAGEFTKMSDYVNELSIISFGTVKKMYMVGGATPVGWTVENAIEMIPNTQNGTFTAYVELKANDGFKFVNQRQWPGGDLNSKDWGTKDGKAFDGDGEQNINSPATDGLYRVSFDPKALTYDIKPAGMYLVGDATPNGWTVEQATPMTYTAPNKFLAYIQLTGGKGFKFVDQQQWPGGDLNSKDWGTKDGKAFDGDGEQNINSPATDGLYRIAFDAQAGTYLVTPASMHLVGSATPNGWTVEQATAMTYVAPNKWTATVTLGSGEFKFVTQKQWPGGNLNSVDWGTMNGTAMGGDAFDGEGEKNIPSPGAGTYTITFDEAKLQYTIAK